MFERTEIQVRRTRWLGVLIRKQHGGKPKRDYLLHARGALPLSEASCVIMIEEEFGDGMITAPSAMAAHSGFLRSVPSEREDGLRSL